MIDEKAASYLVQYPNTRIVDCTILSFSEEGITVSFEGIGILEDGSYEEIEDTVTQLFEL